MWSSTEPADAPGAVPKRQLSPAEDGPRPDSGAGYIGSSLSIDGEIEGAGDLVIDGRVNGSIRLPQDRLEIGQDGSIEATVEVRQIIVRGLMKGSVGGCDRIEITKTGSVEGDVAAKSIVVEDGAVFRGSIDIIRPDSASAAKGETAGGVVRTASAQKSKPSG